MIGMILNMLYDHLIVSIDYTFINYLLLFYADAWLTLSKKMDVLERLSSSHKIVLFFIPG